MESSIFNYVSKENNAKIYDKKEDIDENEKLKMSNILSNVDEVSSIIIISYITIK
jgi:hypothetical protein